MLNYFIEMIDTFSLIVQVVYKKNLIDFASQIETNLSAFL